MTTDLTLSVFKTSSQRYAVSLRIPTSCIKLITFGWEWDYFFNLKFSLRIPPVRIRILSETTRSNTPNHQSKEIRVTLTAHQSAAELVNCSEQHVHEFTTISRNIIVPKGKKDSNNRDRKAKFF